MPLSSVVGASSILRPGVCTSTSRPASPFEGQTIYETDTDRLLSYDGSAWIPYVKQTAGKVLQVVQTVKTDTFTTTSTSYTDVTNLSATITPSATSSKILIIAQISQGQTNNANAGHFRLSGGNSTNYVGDTASNRTRSVFGGGQGANMASNIYALTIVYLDSPSTTSATTYKVQGLVSSGATLYLNRSQGDVDDAYHGRGASSITVMEISG